MRSKKSLINAGFSVGCQIVNILFAFISRMYFIKVLGQTYLGINGLFTQILSVLSLVELGIGPAITFSLYKPIAKGDTNQIKAIMLLYKKIYISISLIILAIGLLLAPFIDFFIRDDISSIPNLYLIFLLFVFNTSISYLFSYKQNLIIANQNKYITVILHNVFFVLMSISQIFILFKTGNYVLYLVAQLATTFIENFAISIKADKLYPFLKDKKKEVVSEDTIKEIKKNTKAMIFHKIGGVLSTATDNIVLSKFVGIISVGIYSNYLLVTNSFTTLFNQLFSAITASVGNLNATSSNKQVKEFFYVLLMVNFTIYGIVSVCLLALFNDFIDLFFGKSMVFSNVIVFLLVLRFYLAGMRNTIFTFKDAMGFYWQDRYRPILEAVLNLTLSLVLIKLIGIAGVIVAGILSNLGANLFIEPYIIYKYKFKERVGSYYSVYIRYFLSFIIIGAVVYLISTKIIVTSKIFFFVKAIVIFLVTVAMFLLLLWNKKESDYLRVRILDFIKR